MCESYKSGGRGPKMIRLVARLMLVAVFAAGSAALADAQAVSRGGGSSGGGSSSGSSGGGGGTASSGGGSSSGGGGSTYSAPPRTPSHSAGSSSGSGSSGSGSSSSGSSGGATYRHHPVDPNGSASSTTTATPPTYARPSDSSAIIGHAVRRPPSAYRPPSYYYSPYYLYNPWTFGAWGLGYGLGYMYDPFYGGYGGYGYPYGSPYGYGYGGGYPYYGGAPYYDGSTYDNWPDSTTQMPEKGNLRIKVKPREAKVLVDGAFVGTVDDFDGVFQKLELTEGRHHVVLQLDHYQPLEFDVMIVAGETINYTGEMHKLGEH
jgi:hypothetical protein